MSEMYADIIPGISLEQLDKTFQYLVPEELKHSISPGSVVKVPFGGGGRHITGFVVGLSGIPAIEPERIKPVAEVLTDNELPESRIIAIAAWMKDEYGCTMSQDCAARKRKGSEEGDKNPSDKHRYGYGKRLSWEDEAKERKGQSASFGSAYTFRKP